MCGADIPDDADVYDLMLRLISAAVKICCCRRKQMTVSDGTLMLLLIAEDCFDTWRVVLFFALEASLQLYSSTFQSQFMMYE